MQNLSPDTDVLTLGSDTLLARRVGPKAALLDRARVNGLSVPSGVLIPEELIRECYARYGSSSRRRNTSIEQNVRLVREEFLRDRLLTALPLIFQDKHWRSSISNLEERPRVAIRPAFSFADGESDVPPSSFQAELNVDGSSAILILEAIKAVLASAQIYQQAMHADHIEKGGNENDANLVGHNLRRDVLIMPMVPAKHAGLAFSQRDYEDDVVFWTRGNSAPITQGDITGERLELARLHRGNKVNYPTDSKSEKSYLHRLQKLLQQFRRVFGAEKDWEIEWADDGEKIWLLQIRPQTRQIERSEIFSALAGIELFSEPVSPFMGSLIEECNPAMLRMLKEVDIEFPAARPLWKIIDGWACINVSLLNDICRKLGLPSILVTDFCIPPNRQNDVPSFRINWWRLLYKSKTIWRIIKHRFAIAKAVQHTGQLLRNSIHEGTSLQDLLDKLIHSASSTLISAFWLQISMILPLRILQRFGLLNSFLSRFPGWFAEFLDDVDDIRTIEASCSEVMADDSKDENEHNPIQDAQKEFWKKHQIFTRNPFDIASPVRNADFRITANARIKLKPVKLNFAMILGMPIWLRLMALLKINESLGLDFLLSLRRFRMSLLERIPENLSLWNTSIHSIRNNSYNSGSIPKPTASEPIELLLVWNHVNQSGSFTPLANSSSTENAEYLGSWPEANSDLPLLSYLWKDRSNLAAEHWLALNHFPIVEWMEIPSVQGLLLKNVARLSPGCLRARRLGINQIIQCEINGLLSNSSSILDGPLGPLRRQNERKTKKVTRKTSIRKKTATVRSASRKKSSASDQKTS